MNIAAGVLFVDAAGKVLLVETLHKKYWDLPGGVVEPGESPHLAAAREIREELGFDITPEHIGRLLVVDHLPAKEGRPDGYRFVFAATAAMHLAAAKGWIVLDSTELKSWRWCTPGEQRARQVHAPILGRRVAAARKASAEGATFYLENGYIR